MPNYRTIEVEFGPHRLRVSARPMGMRGLPGLIGFLPFVTGNEARVRVNVESIEWQPGTPPAVEYLCHFIPGGMALRRPTTALPLEFETNNFYLATSGEYVCNVTLVAPGLNETYQVADFSVFAKDRFAVAVGTAVTVLGLAIAGVVLGAIAL